MEEKNELSDILLEQKSLNRTVKIKRLIVIAVLLALLFVLVIMIMRLINKPNDTSRDDTSSTLTNSILENTPPQSVIERGDITAYSYTESTNDSTDNNITGQGITIIDNNSVNVSPNIVDTTNVPNGVKQTDTNKTRTNSDTSASNRPVTTPENGLKSGHYIQVGAFANAPSKDLLNSITSRGYKYHLQTITSKRLTSVLIGPFSSESSARMELPDIKSSISKNAFYKRIQ